MAAGALLIFDVGFLNFPIFDQLTGQGRFWLTRARSNTASQDVRVLTKTAQVHDRVVRLGMPKKQAKELVRLVEVLDHGRWYRYLTNVLDPAVLSADRWWRCMASAGGLKKPFWWSSVCWVWPTCRSARSMAFRPRSGPPGCCMPCWST